MKILDLIIKQVYFDAIMTGQKVREFREVKPLHHNPKGTKDDFQYDYMTSVNTSECIRFYIDKL